MEISIAISCVILLPRIWRNYVGVPRPWISDSGFMTEKRWRVVSRVTGWTALACFVVALLLFRPWRAHQVNWSEIASAPAYILLCWSNYINQYILERPAITSGLITLNLSGHSGEKSPQRDGTPLTAPSSS